MPRPATAPSPPPASARDRALAVVVSRYNAEVTDRLLDASRTAFLEAGGRPDRLTVIDAPGSWEIPFLARTAALSRRFDAIVALGCIVKGETPHDERLAEAVFAGLTRVSLDTGVPVSLGVLTVASQKQALARAGGEHGNKGADATFAALAMLHAADSLANASAGPARQRVGD